MKRSVVLVANEIGFCHFVGCPNGRGQLVQDSPSDFWSKSKVVNILLTGWTYQQIAVLGIVVIIRGRSPRRKPPQPCCLLMIEAATKSPFADRISASFAVPRVCKRVLMTSRGVVRPAANAPANPPAHIWVIGLYSFVGLMTFESDS